MAAASVKRSIKLGCMTVIGIGLRYSRQACCLPYCLCEINNGIHIYHFIFELLHFCFRMWLGFLDLNKNIGGSTDLVRKRQGSINLHTPIHPPPHLSGVTRHTHVFENTTRHSHVFQDNFTAIRFNVTRKTS